MHVTGHDAIHSSEKYDDEALQPEDLKFFGGECGSVKAIVSH